VLCSHLAREYGFRVQFSLGTCVSATFIQVLTSRNSSIQPIWKELFSIQHNCYHFVFMIIKASCYIYLRCTLIWLRDKTGVVVLSPQISLAKVYIFKMAASQDSTPMTNMGDYKTLSCEITSNNNEHKIKFVNTRVRVIFFMTEQNILFFQMQLARKKNQDFLLWISLAGNDARTCRLKTNIEHKVK